MQSQYTVLKSCLTSVRPLKSLPVRSCPRVTCFPYGPPPCSHAARAPSTPRFRKNLGGQQKQGRVSKRRADNESHGGVGDEERCGDEQSGNHAGAGRPGHQPMDARAVSNFPCCQTQLSYCCCRWCRVDDQGILKDVRVRLLQSNSYLNRLDCPTSYPSLHLQ